MMYNSKNLHYVFHKELFQPLNNLSLDKINTYGQWSDRADAVLDMESPYPNWPILKEEYELEKFSLYTCYPGTLIGAGSPHEIGRENVGDNELKLGFSFDPVSGCPYLPGSSLKGILRSCFPGEKKSSDENGLLSSFISQTILKLQSNISEKLRDENGLLSSFISQTILKLQSNISEKLRDNIFEYNDVFFGAYPDPEKNKKERFLKEDYITAVDQRSNPNPNRFAVLRPGIKLTFVFSLHDADIEGCKITKDIKVHLFQELLCTFGIGAKTNTGYGRLSVEKEEAWSIDPRISPKTVFEERSSHDTSVWKNNSKNEQGRFTQGSFRTDRQNTAEGICIKCGNEASKRPTGGFFPLCNDCRKQAPTCPQCSKKVGWNTQKREWFKSCIDHKVG